MTLILGYPANSFSGWGVEGLNMLLHWPDDVVAALGGVGAVLRDGDPRKPLLDRRLAQSRGFQAHVAAAGSAALTAGEPVFAPLGNDLRRQPVAGGVHLTGTPTVAFPYIEEPEVAALHKDELRQYDRIVVASEWNRRIVGDLGYEATMIPQAVDTVLFNPLIRGGGRRGGKFRVFSGGKCEWRKGQDIVLAAFARFAETHADAVLVAAWDSPWRGLAATFEGHCALGAPPGAHIGLPNFAAWAQKAGIPPHQFEAVPLTPNCKMPDVLSTVDCAVFPSRAEGGANQAAMECIASGVPVIMSPGAGHQAWRGLGVAMAETEAQIVARLEFVLECPSAFVCNGGLPEQFTWPHRIAALQQMLNEVA